MRKFLSIAVISLGLVGCSASTTGNSPASSESSTPTESSQPSSDANSFVYSLVGGGTIDLSRGANAEPIALWFWAPG